ncbi:hypothetical protein CDEST_05209 [Colletotrichum destructivum]|uniref:Uncharacterized protein n=1 Tax=Colletotrichum destructivum TaxID=34406 RepID=A0AAX4IA50_9PEZI|nr:hypothetical protein CDEST_05209 [Colletotrichum destructivum]
MFYRNSHHTTCRSQIYTGAQSTQRRGSDAWTAQLMSLLPECLHCLDGLLTSGSGDHAIQPGVRRCDSLLGEAPLYNEGIRWQKAFLAMGKLRRENQVRKLGTEAYGDAMGAQKNSMRDAVVQTSLILSSQGRAFCLPAS